MVDYITGINGTGKSKIMFEAAVSTAQMSNGSVVFVDCTNKLDRMLPTDIRLINASDYDIKGAKAFAGFLLGICSGNYDITDIFIDSTLDIVSDKNTNIDDFFELMAKLSEKVGVNFHFAVCDKYAGELIYQGCDI